MAMKYAKCEFSWLLKNLIHGYGLPMYEHAWVSSEMTKLMAIFGFKLQVIRDANVV